MADTPTNESENLYKQLASLEQTHRATLNLLEDMQADRGRLDDTQRALINILEDIDDERANTERAKMHLEAVNKELEAFSYSVSHDLRAPLRAVSGFAQVVVEDYASVLDDDGKRYLRLIAENANKMGQLIDDLLTFSRLGRQEMRRAMVGMAALVREVSEEQVSQAAERVIEVQIGSVPPTQGDSAMIRQLLVNLFSNAIKFTKTREKAVIEFGCTPEGAYYLRDNGVGFDMRYVDKLFGVFQRLHSVSEFEGTGVGLALVYRIVTRHGGRVWAEGELDKGATFYFTLPKGETG